MCAHCAHMQIIQHHTADAFFSDLFVGVLENAQPCDVACLFLLSEKRQGSMDFHCKSETWQT